GAASGIGYAIATNCAARGMKVVLADRDVAALGSAHEQLATTFGDHVSIVGTDVSIPDDVQRLAGRTVSAFGAVHLLVSNAGVVGPMGMPMWELAPDDWKWVMDVNAHGLLNALRAFMPLLLDQTDTHVLVTVSIIALGYCSAHPAYVASKHAALGISETLKCQLEDAGLDVGVTVLMPSMVETGIRRSYSRFGENEAAGPHEENANLSFVERSVSTQYQRGLVPRSISPTEAARVAMAAVEQNQFYAFTHEEAGLIVELRHRAIEAALAGE